MMSDATGLATARPLASVVVAAYNAAETLPETIESVLAQSCGSWEMIIVDDGSSDATLELARTHARADGRIRVITQANAGTAAARNAGFSIAGGEWFCFLDADDAMSPDYLERMIAFIGRNPGYDIYSCNAEVVLRDGGRDLMWGGRRWRVPHQVTAIEQLKESSVSPVTLFRPEVFERVAGFRSVYSEDYDFWLRALILGFRHLFNPETLWSYRRREGSKTTALVAEAESLLDIVADAAAMPQLTVEQKQVADRALEFARARIERRRLEEALLRGEFTGARHAYVNARKAFPDGLKYTVGFVLMMTSPALYARVKSARMV